MKLIIPAIEEPKEWKHPTTMRGKASIRCNVWGNWRGYIGRRMVYEIGMNDLYAQWWLEEQQEIQGK